MVGVPRTLLKSVWWLHSLYTVIKGLMLKVASQHQCLLCFNVMRCLMNISPVVKEGVFAVMEVV